MARISNFKRKGSVEVSGATTKREEDQQQLRTASRWIEGTSLKSQHV